jgi:hypothetical protein
MLACPNPCPSPDYQFITARNFTKAFSKGMQVEKHARRFLNANTFYIIWKVDVKLSRHH